MLSKNSCWPWRLCCAHSLTTPAAFDVLDHEILLQCLQTSFAINHSARSGFGWTFLDVASMSITVQQALQSYTWSVALCGVVLGPIILYTATCLHALVTRVRLSPHLQADDTQISGTRSPSDVNAFLSVFNECRHGCRLDALQPSSQLAEPSIIYPPQVGPLASLLLHFHQPFMTWQSILTQTCLWRSTFNRLSHWFTAACQLCSIGPTAVFQSLAGRHTGSQLALLLSYLSISSNVSSRLNMSQHSLSSGFVGTTTSLINISASTGCECPSESCSILPFLPTLMTVLQVTCHYLVGEDSGWLPPTVWQYRPFGLGS